MSDNAGNIYVDNNKSFNIDETNPSVDKIEFSRKTSDGILTTNDFNTEFKYGYYFNNSFYLKIHTSDKKPSSGLSHIEYKLVKFYLYYLLSSHYYIPPIYIRYDLIRKMAFYQKYEFSNKSYY